MTFSFFRRMRYAGGETRGRQIAEYLAGKLDPTSGYENDVCIYLHGSYRIDGPETPYSCYDVMDCGYARLSRVFGKTKGTIIAVSEAQFVELIALYPKRKIVFIPHHHCNFERQERPKDRPVKRVGCCGGDAAIQWPHDRIKVWLEQYGLEFCFTNEYKDRKRVCDFYKNLDIQIVFRPTHSRGIPAHTSPLKLSNAGSFGVPTVAFPEVAFAPEWNGQSVTYADNMGELMRQVHALANDPALYAEKAERARIKAEEYHIGNVAKYYLELEDKCKESA